jgi:CHAD domain-containing protein
LSGGKWIDDLKPTTNLANAARHVLSVRLEVVRDYLPLAIEKADQDSEHVHQLRVGTRRAAAALRIFACCLPSKVHKEAGKHLRKIRRLAAEARDWDVFLAGLKPANRPQGRNLQPGFDFLSGYALAKREAAQLQLERAGKDYPFAFDRFLAETVAAVHKPSAPELRTLLDLARPLLATLLQELEEAAADNLDDYGLLHRVRILGKRLRYAMEVFARCFTSAFREQLYPMVEEMQEVLGAVNDSHVACGRLKTLLARLRTLSAAEVKRRQPGLQSLLGYHETRLPELRRHFDGCWERWHQFGGEAAFLSLIESSKARAMKTHRQQTDNSTGSQTPVEHEVAG